MRNRLIACFLSIMTLAAQTPDLSGVWKADPAKSKGVPPGDYLLLIDQKEGKLVETIGIYGQRGEQRTNLTYDLSGKESRNTYRGLPMKTKATWEGNTLLLDGQVAGPQGTTIKEKYTLAPDGRTLTIENTTKTEGRETQQLFTLVKQPDDAGEPLRKPEQKAGERYKNLKLLQDMPASQLLNTMNSFNVALGVRCDGCHVQGNFAADDKHEKQMARQMITMTRSINHDNFNDKQEVRCYTCHKGQAHPQGAPAFQ